MRSRQSHPMTPLARKLREALDAKGMRQVDVIRQFPDVGKAIVGHWFTGKRQPGLDNLRKLAAILDVSAASLVADEPGFATTPEERMALDLMRELSPDMRQAVLAIMKAHTLKP